MNVIRHLLNEHAKMGALFNQYLLAGEQAHKEKQGIAEEVMELISKHVKLEEQTLFEAFKEQGGEEAEEMVLELTEEHRISESLIDKLKKTEPEDKLFDARMMVLAEETKHHLQEEEQFVFPKAKKVLPAEELEQLGEEMEAFEEKLEK